MMESYPDDPNGDQTETRRHRKRSIVQHEHPDLNQMTVPDNGSNVDEQEEDCNSVNSEPDINDIEAGHNESLQTNDVTKRNKEVKYETTHQTFDEEDKMNSQNKPNDTNNQVDTMPDNGIVYDDTKPKRLPNQKKLKLNLDVNQEGNRRTRHPSPVNNLHESIGILISPDEPDSPTKRRRRLPDTDRFRQDGEVLQNNNENTNDQTLHAVPDIGRGEHYQRSPEMARRKVSTRTSAVVNEHNQTHRCSSPVQRLISRHESNSPTIDIHRKHSSDARLVGNRDGTKPPPQRKVSLEASIEARRYKEQPSVLEQFRRRKVSFDTTALVNGNKLLPLNDEVTVRDKHKFAAYDDDSYDAFQDSCLRQSEPSEIIRHEDGCNDIDTSPAPLIEDTPDDSAREEDQYYDNKAFNYGDESPVQSEIEPNHEEYVHSTIGENHSLNHHTRSHINSNMESYDTYSPFTGKVKRLSAQSDDSGLPKSILKIRKEDAESVVSEDSVVAGRAFKVRKDSIALFTDKNGEVQLQALRKEYSNPWRPFNKNNVKQIWTNRQENFQKYKLHLFVLLLFTMTLVFVVVGLHFHSEHHEKMKIAKKIYFDARKRVLSIDDPRQQDTFSAVLGLNIPSWQQPTHCYSNYMDIHDRTCLKWKDNARLNIAYSAMNDTNCYTIQWDSDDGQRAFDCFYLSDSYWYGPSNATESQWPLKRTNYVFTDSHSNFHGSGTFSHAFEYYWLSSKGASIFVDSTVPIEIYWNTKRNNNVCFIGAKKDAEGSANRVNSVTYTMCNGINIRDTHETISRKYLSRVKSLPQKYLLNQPHWSTVWDSSRTKIKESDVTNLVNQLQKHQLECSSIEIDGKWENHYGDLSFDDVLFPNVSDVLAKISDAGCNTSLNIYPYISFQSESFKSGRLNYEYFLKDKGETVPALVHWQHELGAMLDITYPKAKEWLKEKLANLSQLYEFRTFRLSYGISDWFPNNPSFHVTDTTPSKLKNMYTELVSTFGETVVQTTSRSQDITTLIGISSDIITDTESKQPCISNIVPDILNLGISGYPFVIADGFSIGTNLDDRQTYIPDRNLFIRWMQIAAFLPAMRYTVKPWTYDPEVVEISRNLSRFHKEYIVSAFYDFKFNLLQGEPFLQPLWWVDPQDYLTFTISDQFVVAGRYLVAPIFCRNQLQRDIYVPKGLWMDMVSKAVAKGPMWIRGYKASFYTIPFFEKMPEIM